MHAHEHKKMTFCICISLAQPTESVRESGCICMCVGTHTDRDIHRSINKRCFHFSGIFVFGCLFCNCHAHVEALAAPKTTRPPWMGWHFVWAQPLVAAVISQQFCPLLLLCLGFVGGVFFCVFSAFFFCIFSCLLLYLPPSYLHTKVKCHGHNSDHYISHG